METAAIDNLEHLSTYGYYSAASVAENSTPKTKGQGAAAEVSLHIDNVLVLNCCTTGLRSVAAWFVRAAVKIFSDSQEPMMKLPIHLWEEPQC
jgi:hypothetical protein